jgi:hypothetical protein
MQSDDVVEAWAWARLKARKTSYLLTAHLLRNAGRPLDLPPQARRRDAARLRPSRMSGDFVYGCVDVLAVIRWIWEDEMPNRLQNGDCGRRGR